jgi:hypothetical protein
MGDSRDYLANLGGSPDAKLGATHTNYAHT